jgi:hypothetical protein
MVIVARHSSIRAAEEIAFVLRYLLDCGTQHHRLSDCGTFAVGVRCAWRSYCGVFAAFGLRDDYLRHFWVIGVCVILASSLRI